MNVEKQELLEESKSEYVTPKLTVYGAAAELTRNTNPLGNDDGRWHKRYGS